MAAKRMIARGGRPGPVVVLRLAYGEDLLGSLNEICRREKIRNGVVLTGFGSLTDISVTGAVGASFPPRRFYNLRKPRGVEILAISGVEAIANGVPMNLQSVLAVLEIVRDRRAFSRQLLWFANRNKAGAKVISKCGCENKPTRLDTDHRIDFLTLKLGSQRVYRVA